MRLVPNQLEGLGRRGLFALIVFIWVLNGALFNLPFIINTGTFGIDDIVGQIIVCLLGVSFSLALSPATLIGFRHSIARGIIGVAVLSSVFALILGAIDIYIFRSLAALFDRPPRPQPFIVQWTYNFAIFLFQFALIGAIISVLYTNFLRQERQRELAEARAVTARAELAANKAQLAALRFQLNPHFLFNSLNALSSLVVTNRIKEAEQVLAKLTYFLRETLTSSEETPHTLDAELEMILAYLEIEATRFGDKLNIEIECPSELGDALVPAFLLQPLVENSLKFAVAPNDGPSRVSIVARKDADELEISVRDMGAKPLSRFTSDGFGVGLNNVASRLRLLYGDDCSMVAKSHETGFAVILRMPFETVALKERLDDTTHSPGR